MRQMFVRFLMVGILLSNGVDDALAAQLRPVGAPDGRFEDGNSYINPRHCTREPVRSREGGNSPILLGLIGAPASHALPVTIATSSLGQLYPFAIPRSLDEINFLLLAMRP
jgi:hypothetical protein